MQNYCLCCEQREMDYVKPYFRNVRHEMVYEASYVHVIWRQGIRSEEIKVFLPGYLFVRGEWTESECTAMRRLRGVKYILGSRENGYRLSSDDDNFAFFLFAEGGCIGEVPVTEREGKLVLRPDAFGGMDARIIRVKPREKILQVQFPVLGNQMRLWLGYRMEERQDFNMR